MKIVFLGTSDYGEPSLRMLVKECFDVVAVITQPDRKCGRGLKAAPCAIKQAALDLKLAVFQPESINDPESVALLAGLKPDLLIIIAYGQLLSNEVLRIPSRMSLNIHGSLLPLYRGPSPVNCALIHGEPVTGNSLMQVVRRMDAGPLLLQQERQIRQDDDALSLERALSLDAAGLLLDGLRRIQSGTFVVQDQDESSATYCGKLRKSDGLIDWNLPGNAIINRIRGLAGWPGTFSFLHGKMIKIFTPARFISGNVFAPGTIIGVSRSAMTVACASGVIEITEVQPEGSRRMLVEEFIAGHEVKVGERFVSKPAP